MRIPRSPTAADTEPFKLERPWSECALYLKVDGPCTALFWLKGELVGATSVYVDERGEITKLVNQSLVNLRAGFPR